MGTLMTSTMCVPGIYRGQKRAPDAVELELQLTMRCTVGAVN